jgi:hypothetical protein
MMGLVPRLIAKRMGVFRALTEGGEVLSSPRLS